MNADSAANSICALASLYRRPDNVLSFDALRQAIWQESGRVPVGELRSLVTTRINLMEAQIDVLDGGDYRSRDAAIRERQRDFGAPALCAALLAVAVAVASPKPASALFAPLGAK